MRELNLDTTFADNNAHLLRGIIISDHKGGKISPIRSIHKPARTTILPTECCLKVSFNKNHHTRGMTRQNSAIEMARSYAHDALHVRPVLANFRLVSGRDGTAWRSLLGLYHQICHKADNSDACDVTIRCPDTVAWGPSLHNKNDRQDRKRDSRSDE